PIRPLYINGWTVAVQRWVAVHKRRPPFWIVFAPDRCTGPLCEVPIM
ncbi:unnamed protein product, partial [Staurois parvus]